MPGAGPRGRRPGRGGRGHRTAYGSGGVAKTRVSSHARNSDAAGSTHEPSGRVRAAHDRRARHPLRPSLVHRRARHPQVRGRGAGGARGCLRRGDRLRRLGHRGSHPRLRGRHARQARPVDLPDPAVARRPARHGPDVLRPAAARRGAELRRPPARAAARADQGRRPRLHLLHAPRDRVLPPRAGAGPARASGARRRRRLLRPRAPRHRPRLPSRRHHDAREHGHLGRVQPPRGRPGPERDRPALRRRAQHGRQHHDLPHGRQGGGAHPGHLRHLHAEAVLRAPRLGHAHAPLALRGRLQRLLRGRSAPTS